MRVWVLRGVWLTLPLSAGAAASDALTEWDDAPKIVASALLWVAWGAGTLAVLAPRPPGLTLLRTVAPTFAVLAIAGVASGETSGVEGWGAVAATCAAAGLAMLPDFAIACVNGIAYGDELRFPLRTPPALFLGPLPLARALVVISLAAGPLLLADGEVVWGVLALVLGAPAALLGSRALHGLARRWVVIVPAGFVVVDPMTVTDSILVTRRQVRSVRAVDAADVPDGALDLRLGATTGNVLAELGEPTEILRALRGRRGQAETGTALAVAVVRREQLLETLARRRVKTTPAPE